ncbi:coagulation factor VIII isoform X1 [Trichomycterus rosablanca]
MSALFSVENCAESNQLPEKRNVQHDEDEDGDEDYQADDFISIVLRPGGPPSILRSSGRGAPKTWVHYISAEEVSWNYVPQGDRNQPQRVGQVYKKVAYVEYTDKTFTVKKSQSSSLIGPELRGEVNDQFQIIFKNMAGRPFNIYPNGLASVQPLKKTEKQLDLRSLAVPPGEIMMYQWKVTLDDAPTEADPRCLTRLYHSTLDPERDTASGLVGPLIICKSQSLDKRGKVVMSDREKHLMFSAFDENKSWYVEENLKKLNRGSPNSNIMYSVNGLMYNSLQFKMCVGDVMLWHVASVGMRSNFLSVYFTGNPFEKDKTYGTVLTLFPMTGDTVTTEMETEGEWEISAFDPVLKTRGMSMRYSVFNCERVLPLADNEDYEYDFDDYVERNFPGPRGFGEKNRTVAVRVCKKLTSNETRSDQEGQRNRVVCKRKLVPVEEVKDLTSLSQGGIPQDVLDQLDEEITQNSLSRQKRHVDNSTWEQNSGQSDLESTNETSSGTDEVLVEDENLISSNVKAERNRDADGTGNVFTDPFKKFIHRSNLSEPLNLTSKDDSKPTVTNRIQRNTWGAKKDADKFGKPNDPLSDNEILTDSDRLVETQDPHKCTLKNHKFDPKSQHSQSTSSHNQTLPPRSGSADYDDYEDEANETAPNFNSDESINIRSSESLFRSYYIAAEEVTWNYGIEKPPQLINSREMRRGRSKYFPTYRKVVYRAYHDKEFRNPVKRGELDEHLGIMGPVLKAEINDVLTVVFKNLATRPYSLHLHGVYDRTMESSASQGEDLGRKEGPGDPVPPGQERVYNWRITKRQGPSSKDFDCKAGAYYSTVDMEKDVNSGLIGPLLICRPGTLRPRFLLQPGVQDLFLLFTIFDETKSWYLDHNIREFCTPPCQASVDDPWFQTSNKFAAINGYVAETLPGLAVAQHQTSRWHLMNVGSGGEFHAVHFHGIPFSVGKDQEHRMGIFNLYPGVFGSIEMRPGIVGTWLVECTIGEHQLSGMRAKLLVYDPQCVQPLGMQSGWIEDDQITESDHYGHWEARLARLHLSGSVNAWIGNSANSWIQVDLLRPMVVHGIQTQGAKTSLGLREMFTVIFTISYSLDQKVWKKYKGNSSESEYKLNGNMDGYRIKENVLSPPIIARYVCIHPLTQGTRSALRFELLGCDLNSCSLPLGMQRRLIPDNHITASSFLQNWRLSWTPDLARLNQEGRANAWRPTTNNPHEWLQVDFEVVKRITGIVTQGARSVLTPMMVTEFTVSVSDDGHTWTPVTQPGTKQEKMFEGNSEHDEEKLNVLEPPLFTRYIRFHPKGWLNHIALRVEFLGCNTQQRL